MNVRFFSPERKIYERLTTLLFQNLIEFKCWPTGLNWIGGFFNFRREYESSEPNYHKSTDCNFNGEFSAGTFLRVLVTMFSNVLAVLYLSVQDVNVCILTVWSTGSFLDSKNVAYAAGVPGEYLFLSSKFHSQFYNPGQELLQQAS